MTDKVERRQVPRKPTPTVTEIRACFHRLWSSQVGKDGYVKRDWQELQELLFRKFKIEI